MDNTALLAALTDIKSGVDGIGVEVDKIGGETTSSLALIADLELKLKAGAVVDAGIEKTIADLKASVGKAKASADKVDAMVTDLPPVPPAPPPPPAVVATAVV